MALDEEEPWRDDRLNSRSDERCAARAARTVSGETAGASTSGCPVICRSVFWANDDAASLNSSMTRSGAPLSAERRRGLLLLAADAHNEEAASASSVLLSREMRRARE